MARCEDYPCCGHGVEGCEDRPEFHMDYYLANPHLLRDPMDPDYFEDELDA